MRKLIALLVVILAIGGSAMAINGGVFSGNRAANNTRVAQPQAENLVDIATVEPEAPATEAPATEAPATEAPATEAPATEAPTATPVVTAEPAEVNEPEHNAMSFMTWLNKAQSTETGALNGTFDEASATRVKFIKEEVTGNATFELAGRYFSVVVKGYQFTAGHKSAGKTTFRACDEHEGYFFDWTTRYNGEPAQYVLTTELVDELKEVAVCWQDGNDADGNPIIVYGILLCKHEGGATPPQAPVQPTVAPTATPVPTTPAPTATPAPTTPAPTATPVPTTPAPTATPVPTTPAPTATPVPTTPAPTATPVPTTPAPTATPVPTTPAPTATPVPTTPAPTATPAPTQAPTPTPEPVKIEWEEPEPVVTSTPEPPRPTVAPSTGHNPTPAPTIAENQQELDQGGRPTVEGNGAHSAKPTKAPANQEATTGGSGAHSTTPAPQAKPTKAPTEGSGAHSATPVVESQEAEEPASQVVTEGSGAHSTVPAEDGPKEEVSIDW